MGACEDVVLSFCIVLASVTLVRGMKKAMMGVNRKPFVDHFVNCHLFAVAELLYGVAMSWPINVVNFSVPLILLLHVVAKFLGRAGGPECIGN